MSAAFTPGPWEASTGFCLAEPRVGLPASVRAEGRQIALVRCVNRDAETAAANARLIAAAPELYEAVRLAVNLCSKAMQKPLNLNGDSPYDIAMRALAKARGDA